MPPLELIREAGLARVVLDRPEALNAWDATLGDALLEAIAEVAADASVRAVVITGAGRAFCSGADLKAGFDTTPEGHPDLQSALHERYHPVIEGVRAMPKPVVAAVNGGAVGVGCALALACDLVVARRSAYFLLAFAGIGLVPDGGSSAFVPTRAGWGRAMEMALLAERVPAEQALAWGLVNRVIDDDRFDDEVTALGERLAAGPTRAYAAIKLQLNTWTYRGLAEQLELEASLQQEMGASQDFVEGVTAFLQKRPAAFGGR